jgi:uncharacterized protein YbaP (TraB family)
MKIARFLSPSLVVLFSLVSLLVSGEESKHAPIWKLSDEDSTVYLAGSVHLLREKDMPIPEAFDRVYEKADELVFEIDLADMMSPAMALKIREMGSLPEGETLADRLAPTTHANLRDYLRAQNIPSKLFDQLTPGMVYITLGSIEANRHGARADLGLEVRYYRKSVNDNKPSRGLETAEFQISRFDEIDPEIVEQLIVDTLDEADESEESLDEIIAAWKSGNEKRIAELIVDRLAETPEVKKVLLDDRNANWVPEVEKALQTDKDILFIVGAAHLAGEGSLIEMLRKKGYELEQITTVE